MRKLRCSGLLRLVSVAGLILQLMLVAGHHHNSGHAGFAVHQLSNDAVPSEPDRSHRPASHDERGNDSCQFCWAMAAAGTAVSADATFLATPHLRPLAGPHLYQDVQVDFSDVGAFDARGPPAAGLI